MQNQSLKILALNTYDTMNEPQILKEIIDTDSVGSFDTNKASPSPQALYDVVLTPPDTSSFFSRIFYKKQQIS